MAFFLRPLLAHECDRIRQLATVNLDASEARFLVVTFPVMNVTQWSDFVTKRFSKLVGQSSGFEPMATNFDRREVLFEVRKGDAHYAQNKEKLTEYFGGIEAMAVRTVDFAEASKLFNLRTLSEGRDVYVRVRIENVTWSDPVGTIINSLERARVQASGVGPSVSMLRNNQQDGIIFRVQVMSAKHSDRLRLFLLAIEASPGVKEVAEVSEAQVFPGAASEFNIRNYEGKEAAYVYVKFNKDEIGEEGWRRKLEAARIGARAGTGELLHIDEKNAAYLAKFNIKEKGSWGYLAFELHLRYFGSPEILALRASDSLTSWEDLSAL